MSVEQLATHFIELIEERDFIVEFNEAYNERCYEIDDVLVPQILDQVPQGEMDQFNQLINTKPE